VASDADPDHVAGVRRARKPDHAGRGSGDDGGAGEHRGGPTGGRGEGKHYWQRVPHRRVGELEPRVRRPQRLQPGVVGSEAGAARSVDDVQAGQLVQVPMICSSR
jgi:hypothetical protein